MNHRLYEAELSIPAYLGLSLKQNSFEFPEGALGVLDEYCPIPNQVTGKLIVRYRTKFLVNTMFDIERWTRKKQFAAYLRRNDLQKPCTKANKVLHRTDPVLCPLQAPIS
jgi:hypothetical protein